MEQIYAEDLISVFTPGRTFLSPITLLNIFVQNAFVIAGVITLVLLIFSGFRFIVAAGSGDTKQMEGAKKAITGALLGLILVIGSVWIIQIIEAVIGIKILTK